MHNKSNLQKRYLLIDGNYFAHRLIHGIRIGQPDFNLDGQQEMYNFENGLNNSLLSIFSSFNNDFHNLIDNIVFVFDKNSWRKDVKYEIMSATNEPTGMFEYLRPYYIDKNSTEPLGYKENRVAQKEGSDINFDNFHQCIKNFITKIEKTVPVMIFDGAEGDDALFFLTQEFTKRKIESIIFATDGDLKSLVNEYTILLRNTKSKDLPNGEFIISKNLNNKLFSEKTMMQRFTEIDIDSAYYNLLFNIDIDNNGTTRSVKQRFPGVDINLSDYYKNLIVKVITGDKKDNIFPIIRWVGNGASGRNMKVTEKMIEKAFEMSLYDYDEKTCEELFSDNLMMSTILLNLRMVTKQYTAPLDKIAKHYKHNLKMNRLDMNCIPEYVYKNYLTKYKEIDTLIYQDLSRENLFKLNLAVNTSDSAKELIVSSIPKDLTESERLEFYDEFKNTQQSTNPLINDILNS